MIQSNAGGGVLITDAPGTSVAASTIGGAGELGNGTIGIDVESSANVSITASTVSGNADAGIYVDLSPGVVISGILAEANTGSGIDLFSSNGGSITSSTIDGTAFASDFPGFGFSAGSSANVTVTGLTVFNNASDGIYLADSMDAVFTGIQSRSNGGDGIHLIMSPGVSIASSTIGGTVTGAGNGAAGIDVMGSANVSIGGTAAGVLVAGNAGDGIDFDSTSPGGQVNGSTVSGNSGVGISFLGTTDSTLSGEVVSGDTIQTNQTGGVLIVDANETSVTSSTIGGGTAGLGNLGYGVSISGSSNVTIGDPDTFDTTVANNADVGISATGSPLLALQNLLVYSNVGSGLFIASSIDAMIESDVVEFNMGDGIDLSGSTGGVLDSIMDLANQGAGLNLTLGAEASVGNLAVSGNGSDGIEVTASEIVLTNATVVGNAGIGISLTGLNNAGGINSGPTLIGVTVQSNKGGGIYVVNDTVGGSIAASTIGGSTAGQGNSVFGLSLINSPNVTIGGSGAMLIQGNGGVGISLATSDGVVITGVDFVVGNGGDGIDIASSTGVHIDGATIVDDAGSGIGLTAGSNGASITGSTISGNLGDGVTSSASSNLNLGGASGAGLTISGNLGTGIAIYAGEEIAIAGDTIQTNRAGGIALDAVSGVISSSTIGGTTPNLGNVGFGIAIAQSPGVSLLNVQVLTNAGFGVFVSSSDQASIVGGRISGNVGSGLAISDSPHSTIGSPGSVFTVADNVGDGIDVAISEGLTIVGVEVAGNAAVGINVADSATVTIGSPTGGVYVHDNGDDGINLANSDNSSVSYAAAVHNMGSGLVLASPQTTVTYSNLQSNEGSGLEIDSSSNSISGTVVDSNQLFGILINNTVSNRIGLPGAGVLIESNASVGVLIMGSQATDNFLAYDAVINNKAQGVFLSGGAQGNSIGTLAAGTGDTISGNVGDGVSIINSPGNFLVGGDVIEVNGQSGVRIIGLGSVGTGIFDATIVGNSFDGITILQGEGTGIGSVGHPDVISQNAVDGISIVADTSGNPTTIQGDFIGTDATGEVGQGNGLAGIYVGQSLGVVIGSSLAGGGNVVSANRGGGIELFTASFNSLVNNRIGTDLSGMTVLSDVTGARQAFGVFVNGSDHNMIGGANAASGNVIAGTNNAGDFGVQVSGQNAVGNVIAGNLIGISARLTSGPTPYVALGDHVGILIDDAPNTTIAANVLGGSDFAEILITGPNASGTFIGGLIGSTPAAGNTIDGAIPPVNQPIPNAFPTGVLIVGVGGTTISANNLIEGLTVGVEVIGVSGDPNVAAQSTTTPPPATILGNVIINNAFGVLLNESPSNLVFSNAFGGNSLAAVEILGVQAANNLVASNTFGDGGVGGTVNPTDNLIGVYVENAPSNTIAGNVMDNGGMAFVDPSIRQYQAGVYLFGPYAAGNTVVGNTITNMDGYGIVFVGTPQTPPLANVEANNNVQGNSIANILTDADGSAISLLPGPQPIAVPPVSAASIAGVKVQVSSAFSGRRPIAAKTTR